VSWILITVELKSNSVWNDLLKVGKPTQALIISCEPLHNLQRICLHSATKYVLAYKARQLMLDSTVVYMNFWTLHRWAWVSLQGQIVRFRNCMWKAFWQKVKTFGNKFSYIPFHWFHWQSPRVCFILNCKLISKHQGYELAKKTHGLVKKCCRPCFVPVQQYKWPIKLLRPW
jgi:hypothetical protein